MNNHLLTVIDVLDKNQELLRLIIGVIFILLMSLFLYVGGKFWYVICLKFFANNQHKLDNVLSSFSNKNWQGLVLKLSYALVFFASIALAVKLSSLVAPFLAKIKQILNTTSQLQCLEGYRLIKLVVNIGYFIAELVVCYVIFKLVIFISKNTKFDVKKILQVKNKNKQYQRLRLVAIFFIMILVSLFRYVDINFIHPMLDDISTMCLLVS